MSELPKIEVSKGGESMKLMNGGNAFEPTLKTTGGKKRTRGGENLIKPLSGGNSNAKTVGGKRKSRKSGKSRKNRKSRSRSRK